jgi:hypothetical protein
MASSRLLLLAVTAIALAIAAPAGALTGYGAAGPLRAATPPALTTSKAEQKHTCQAKSGHQQATGKTQALVGTVKKPAVVACEQPPRSQVITQGLKQAGAAALATFG